jgi:GNAT superfamily N-acetyltransferase
VEASRDIAAELGEIIMVRIDRDTIVLANANTTIGYARYSKSDLTLDYIFVSTAFRRKGYGRHLVKLCEAECLQPLLPAPPISPLGHRFFAASPRGKA